MVTRSSIALLVLLLIGAGEAKACDFCNCLYGINPYYTGSNSFALHFLLQRSESPGAGVGWFGSKLAAGPLRQPYHSIPGADGAANVPTRESRATIELSYQHHVSERVMLTLLVPMTRMEHRSATDLTISGLGDPSLLAHWVMTDPIGVRSTLLLGGGVKLPLADHRLRDASGAMLDPRLQPGSGVPSLLLTGTMTVGLGRWTVALDAFGAMPTGIIDGNRLGSSLSATATVNHDLIRNDATALALVGLAGIRGEVAGLDRVAGEIDHHSGFSTAYANLGAELVWHSLRFDLTVLAPIAQMRRDEVSEGPRILSGIRIEI